VGEGADVILIAAALLEERLGQEERAPNSDEADDEEGDGDAFCTAQWEARRFATGRRPLLSPALGS
jgi:hypothetical protein